MNQTQLEREALLKTLRDKALQQTEEQAAKQRFGLFSQPPPLSIGDNSYDKLKKSYRDQTGKVMIAPRNFLTSAPKSGKISSSYFSDIGYVTIGSKYVDPDRQQRLYELEKKRKMPQDRAVFKPADFEKTIIHAPFEHLSDLKPELKINYKGEDGRVIIGKKNILTGPTNELNKAYDHIKDEYSRKAELERKYQKEHHEKMKDRQPFKTWDTGNKNFVSDKHTFGLDQALPKKKDQKPFDPHKYPHEKEFRPSHPPKTGYNSTINKFPQYIGDPLRQVVRKNVVKTKDSFRLNHPGDLTRPTPSVSCNKINLRKDISAHF